MTHKKRKEDVSFEDCDSADTEEAFEENEPFVSEYSPENDADSESGSENAALVKRVEDLTSAYLTLAADFENYKKRTSKNMEKQSYCR